MGSNSTPGSTAPPQNYPLPGQKRLNHQRLLRRKRPQRWSRMHPLLGESAQGRCLHHNSQDERPLLAPSLANTEIIFSSIRVQYIPRALKNEETALKNHSPNSSEFSSNKFDQIAISFLACNWLRHVWSPNGWRYLLVGGRRQRHFTGTNFEPRKTPENALTPTSQMHAVLARGHPHARCAITV
jgi:hypothetical protein